MRFILLLLLSANTWAVNPAVIKLVHAGSGTIDGVKYLRYRVHCGNGQQADMVRWTKEGSSHYCVGDEKTDCSHKKVLTASRACARNQTK